MSLLPQELALNIFGSFDVVDLLSAGMTCRAWFLLSIDDTLWCRLLEWRGVSVSRRLAWLRNRGLEVSIKAMWAHRMQSQSFSLLVPSSPYSECRVFVRGPNANVFVEALLGLEPGGPMPVAGLGGLQARRMVLPAPQPKVLHLAWGEGCQLTTQPHFELVLLPSNASSIPPTDSIRRILVRLRAEGAREPAAPLVGVLDLTLADVALGALWRPFLAAVTGGALENEAVEGEDILFG